MTSASLALIASLLFLMLILVKPVGLYMADVMEGRPGATRPVWVLRVGAPLERLIYRLSGIDPSAEMGWKRYMIALLLFNGIGALVLYALQRVQLWLPLNPQQFANVTPDSSFNTAVSFVTNTNWQGYSGESTMSYLTQMLGLAVQNFSAYKDVQTLETLAYQAPKTDAAGNPLKDAAGNPVLENLSTQKQTLPMGPIASQEAIKLLGTNGGGFTNANSAHPYENPTPVSNLLEMLAMVLIPAALTYTFGKMVGDTRQGWAVLAAMLILFAGLVTLAVHSEQLGNPRIAALGVDQTAGLQQPGGNMEGKEVRFGIAGSALFGTISTVTSTGAVNATHDSFTPLGGFVPLFNMQLGEVVLGGVGTGLYSMLIFAIIGVFIAGLMIGRTPEYLGKKIESFEMKMSSIAILVMPFIVLLGTAIAVSVADGKAGVANPGAHGFSEILYAFTSAGNNNGSAFAGISANTPFYNTILGLVMWLGRFWPIAAVLAVAGSLAAKKRVPVTAGTMLTYGPTFIILLIGTVLLVGALTFVPALALGPLVEHLVMWGG